MERSLETVGAAYVRPAARRWVREAPSSTTSSDGPNISFKLLILFLVILYSNVAVVFKPLNAFRPALVVAFLAIGMMVIELGQTRRSFKLSWPQGLLLIGLLSIAFVSSFDAMWPKLAFEQTADLAKIVLIYVVIENTVTTASRLHTILLTMVVGGLFPAVGTIKNYLGGILVEGSRGAWQGVFANPNEVAFALVLLVPIAAALASKSGWIMKLALWGVIATYLVAIFFTYSRGGLLALFAVFGLMGWKQKSMLIRAVMVAGLIGALFIGGMYWKRDAGFKDVAQDTTYNQRIATIKAGIRMFEARPLLGVGPGCSVVAYPIYVPPEAHCGCQLQLVIHNTFVQALSEVGILGFGAFMLFLGVSFLHLWKIQKGPLAAYGGALEVALWGFMVCSLSGGFSYTWWPYLLIGLVVATKHIAASLPAEGNNAAAAV